MNIKLVVLVLAALAVLLAGCSSPTATPAATPATSATPAPTTPVSSATPTPTTSAPMQASVEIKNFAFSPQDVHVAKGGTVTWTNLDSVTHTISFNGVQSSGFNNGETYAKTFSDAGTFDYNCGIHTYMKGRVLVE